MMTTQKERNETHAKAKKMLKREIDAVYYDEPFDEVYLRVTFGPGKAHDVYLAARQYEIKMKDVLEIDADYDIERYIPFKEEMTGFIGKGSYILIINILEFHVKNDDLREEVGWLYEEENWSELEKIFGGN